MSVEKPKVSIVVLNWNGKEYLEDCLASLEKQTYPNIEIILVDNASKDDSVGFVKEYFPKVKIIINHKNLGFAAGNNVGIKAALGEYVMVLNNDTEVDSNCVEELVKVIEKDRKIGGCATKILSYFNREIIDVAGLIIYPDGSARGRGRLEKAKDNFNEQEEIFFGSDCAAIYRREMLDEIGLYDEEFFAHHDETDLGMRAHWAGWKCIYVPTAVVHHRYSASHGAYSPLKAFLVERNRVYVAIKNFPLPLLLISPFYTIIRLALQAYGALTNRGSAGRFTESFSKVQLVIILAKAYISAAINMPKFLKKRKEILSNKKINNAEFYQLFRKYSISAKELALKD
ncbi:glycosyltransferase family 2 protein [Candidatus Margulisiibacteriota bacterium]